MFENITKRDNILIMAKTINRENTLTTPAILYLFKR